MQFVRCWQKQMAKKDVRVITTLHGTDITVLGIDPSLTNLIRFGIEESDAVTAVSYSLRDQTKKLLNIQKEIQVVHNFIDTDKLEEPSDTDKLKRRLNIQSDEKVMFISLTFVK